MYKTSITIYNDKLAKEAIKIAKLKSGTFNSWLNHIIFKEISEIENNKNNISENNED
jgi:hypothetical protein